MYVTFSASKS